MCREHHAVIGGAKARSIRGRANRSGRTPQRSRGLNNIAVGGRAEVIATAVLGDVELIIDVACQ